MRSTAIAEDSAGIRVWALHPRVLGTSMGQRGATGDVRVAAEKMVDLAQDPDQAGPRFRSLDGGDLPWWGKGDPPWPRPRATWGPQESGAAVSRDYLEADHEGVAALWRAAGVAVMGPVELEVTLRHEGNALLVEHSAAGSVVGVVLGTFDGRRGWIHRLAVEDAARRTGIARRLVADIEDRLRAAGAPRINLLVVSPDPGTAAFWRSLGYGSCPDVLFTKPT